MSSHALVTMDAQAAQVGLKLDYRDLARRGDPAALPTFDDVEFRTQSQNGEDGILLYLFGLLGAETKLAVEICAGTGIECNSGNLVVNHGWHALLVDGDEAQLAAGTAYYATHRRTCVSPPTLAQRWITTESVNAVVRDNGFSGPVDLLSIDLDGNDYWVWRALTECQPRVVVVEFNAPIGPGLRVSMAYDPTFVLDHAAGGPYRCGASLAAFAALAEAKGYRLVGAESHGFNAFFVRSDLAVALLPTVTPTDVFRTNPRLARMWTPGLAELVLSQGRWEHV